MFFLDYSISTMANKQRSRISTSNKRNWAIGSAIIIAFFLVAITGIVWFLHVGSPDKILAVADQFQPDPSWQLVSERVEAPRKTCIDIECPSVSRRWRTGASLTRDEFATLLKETGWDFEIEGSCKVDPSDRSDYTALCSATGIINNYRVTLTVRSSDMGNEGFVGLGVREARNETK